MLKQEEQPEEKKKHNGMTKYEKLKLRIIVFIAVLLITQAVFSVGSILHFKATLGGEIFPEEHGLPCCACSETGVLYSGSNKE